ncbi:MULTISPECIES: SusC/RagA family TonB-linked outer membrane protein [unclassified Carboxylicivirga]|uniref:SusC/RagA family TonB-linked outer membrane protein n=1 Tax=Carboxylicivirga TaxID=1628153 RepID=UPI003D34351E
MKKEYFFIEYRNFMPVSKWLKITKLATLLLFMGTLQGFALNGSDQTEEEFKKEPGANALALHESIVNSEDQVGKLQDVQLLTGKVIDASGEPIPGVTVSLKGTTIGTVTNFDGEFTLSTDQTGDVLLFSFIGMKTVEVQIDNREVYEVVMQDETVGLEEVVAIGYGKAKKGELSTSIATVEGVEKMSSRAIKSTEDFLQGNVAGVTVVQDGGDPTSTPNVVIRGVGSVNNESPLWVVDGMPYYGGPLNPNDIESMTILKDAASASIYGAQASSGVIVVTTKSGKEGKPKVNVDLYTGVQTANKLPTPLTAQEQSMAYNIATDNAGQGRLPAHDAAQNPWGAVNRTNWVDAIFRNASVYNANISLSGGNDKGRYMTSFNYQDREGLLVGTNSKKFGFRMKSEYDLSDKITVGENFYLTHNNAVGANTSSSYSGAIINAIYMPSAAPVYDEDGAYHGVAPEGSIFAGAYGDVYNPVALLKRPNVNNPTTTYNANAYIDADIVEGLKFRSSFSYDIVSDDYKKFTPMIPESGRRTEMNYLDQSWSDRHKWIWDNQLTYNVDFGKHKLDLTGVYSSQKTNYEANDVHLQGFSQEADWYQYMENGEEMIEWGSDVYEDALTSAIGRVRYNYADKYYLSGSIRSDRTSRLDKANNSDVFSSVSAAWRVSSEPFMQSLSWINSLKLRLSWGQIGNIQSVGYYAYNVPLSSHRPYLGAQPTYLPGYYVGQQSNRNLKWETSETYDAGIDMTLLDNKLEVVADYFWKYTNDMIMTNSADPHTGVSKGPTSNVGTVKNWGYELGLTYRDHSKPFKYSVGLNLSSIQNELQDLEGYTSDYIAHNNNVRGTLYPYRSMPGESLYSFYLIPCEGTFKSQAEVDAHARNGALIQPNAQPGDLKFTDVDGDGQITDGDRIFHGNAFPDFTYSMNFSAEYKGFDLAMLWQGVGQTQVFNGYKYSAYNMAEQTYNRDNRVLNAWSESNRGSNIPRLQTVDNNRNFGTNSTWYLEDAAYLRLKNLTLGYTLPASTLNKLVEGSSLRVYVSAENLLTITDYSGMDPEVGGIGFDVGNYPVARVLSAGLSLSF